MLTPFVTSPISTRFRHEEPATYQSARDTSHVIISFLSSFFVVHGYTRNLFEIVTELTSCCPSKTLNPDLILYETALRTTSKE